MTRRDPIIVLVLTLFTCGFYGLYWQFVTTSELKTVSGRDDLNPMVDLLLGFVTCGIWSFYVMYRNSEITHNVLTARAIQHENRTQTIMLLLIASFFVGVTYFLAMLFMQEDYNKLA